MALETLRNVETIDNFDVCVMDDLRSKYPERFTETGAMDHVWFENTIRPNKFIYVRHDKNSLSFTLQNGPVKEFGKNGCQVSTMIAASLIMIKGLNAKFPSIYNQNAITHLQAALDNLELRTKDREKRGVEGLSKL